MAASKKANLGPTKKLKPSPVAPILSDVFIPKTITDAVVTYAVPYGKAARAIGGIAKKGAKYVNKVYRNMGR
jgi:hypothetical protein